MHKLHSPPIKNIMLNIYFNETFVTYPCMWYLFKKDISFKMCLRSLELANISTCC